MGIGRLDPERRADRWPRTPGKTSGEILCHSSQPGRVKLAERQLKVKQRPILQPVKFHDAEVRLVGDTFSERLSVAE
jgi:hypothetical protein